MLDARVLYDGNGHTELANQLHGPNTCHMLVKTQSSLQQLFIRQKKDGTVSPRDFHRHAKQLHLTLTKKKEQDGLKWKNGTTIRSADDSVTGLVLACSNTVCIVDSENSTTFCVSFSCIGVKSV